MSLREQGFRFMVSPDRKQANWVHPVDVAINCPDWIDCTEMSDDEFDAFMSIGSQP